MTVSAISDSGQAALYISSQVTKTVFEVTFDPVQPGSKQILPNNDPLGCLLSFLQESSPQDASVAVHIPALSLYDGLIHFEHISSKPIVFHTQVQADFGIISALRHSGFVFLQSFGPEDGQYMALAAHLISSVLKKPVVHFYTQVERMCPFQLTAAQISTALEGAASRYLEPSVDEEEDKEEKKPLSVPEVVETVLKDFCHDEYHSFEYSGSDNAEVVLVVFGQSEALRKAVNDTNARVGLLLIRVYSPFNNERLLDAIPSSAVSLALLDQVAALTTAWVPLVQDVFSGPSDKLSKIKSLSGYQLGEITDKNAKTVLEQVINDSKTGKLAAHAGLLGKSLPQEVVQRIDISTLENIRELEFAYLKVLKQLFPSMNILNDLTEDGINTSPEYGFGKFLAQERALNSRIKKAYNLAKTKEEFAELSGLLAQWSLSHHNQEVVDKITSTCTSNPELAELTGLTPELLKTGYSNWIIGSDSWSYDLGASGVHHVLSSGENINMLLIDSLPQQKVISSHQRKKDVGLYAMGYSNVYVASVAIYSSYTQLLQAFTEAAAFNGPSIIVAYLPFFEDTDDSLAVLKETKRAVETGYWPLYRYNPVLPEETRFSLDSFTIRKALQNFLDRENKLTMLSRKRPVLARNLEASHDNDVRLSQAKKARDAYSKLLEGLSGPPLTVLFASDGGQAESVARRLATRAKGRGLKSSVCAFDDFELDDLPHEQNLIFVTSTAGQGEFPQNGRNLWDGLKNNDLDLTTLNVGIFGMGDSDYWPRKEDEHYYNKPAKDLASRTEHLGAKELVPLGLGDDQDADGWATGYNEWEALLWTALGVDHVAGVDEPPPRTNEDLKIASNYLRGTIGEGLKDKSTGAISAEDQQLTKFHGIYMQDDRDIRDERKAKGLEPAYSFMVRVRLPGCVATPEQWLKIDELSDTRGNGTYKITTRGTFQLHGVIKEDLKPAIRGMNSVLMDTFAACGDVDRNIVASALPENAKVHRQILEVSRNISDHLLPRTTAYYEIWLEGEDENDKPGDRDAWENRKDGPTKKPKKELVSQSTIEDHEPLYSNVYLPRKFKINIAVPPYNDVDVYSVDVGLIAIVETNNIVTGFNVCVGGGMGSTHNNKKTYPRLASLIGYAPTDKIQDVCEKIMLVQRDNGDRSNRKHARLKYTVDDMTVEGFKAEVEKYLGYNLEPARDHVPFTTHVDSFGWVKDEEGYNHFTVYIENGRVEDNAELQFKSGFRELANYVKGSDAEFRMTANGHVLLSYVVDSQMDKVKSILAKYKLDNIQFSGLRLASGACVAFPTCGLAMAESERYLPKLIDKVEAILEDLGLRRDSIVMRMTGCPNGCARPWLAEIGLVGKAYGAYNLMLGGGHVGERLNKLYRSSLKEDEILSTLRPMFKSWALERKDDECFGDFVIRKGIISATREGKDWWDNVEPGLE